MPAALRLFCLAARGATSWGPLSCRPGVASDITPLVFLCQSFSGSLGFPKSSFAWVLGHNSSFIKKMFCLAGYGLSYLKDLCMLYWGLSVKGQQTKQLTQRKNQPAGVRLGGQKPWRSLKRTVWKGVGCVDIRFCQKKHEPKCVIILYIYKYYRAQNTDIGFLFIYELFFQCIFFDPSG